MDSVDIVFLSNQRINVFVFYGERTDSKIVKLQKQCKFQSIVLEQSPSRQKRCFHIFHV